MGSSGWEAYTIGFTLIGYIIAGAGLGWFLDSRFGTSFWLPLLFLVGVGAGFREMFVTLGRISKEQDKQRREAQEKERLAANNRPPTSAAPSSESPEPAPTRQRIFSVPPPPLNGEMPSEAETVGDEDESVEQLIQKLMAESNEENPSNDPSGKMGESQDEK